MADEAVVRIVLQDDGGTTAGGAPPPPMPPPSGGTSSAAGGATPTAPPGGYTHMTGRFVGRYDDVDMNDVAFFQEQARRRRKREEVMQKIDEAYHEMYPTPEVQFDPTVEAQRLLDARKRREEIYKEMDKLSPPPAFDPAAEAFDRLMKEKRKQDIKDVYETLTAEIPTLEPVVTTLETTPFQAAKDRYEAKQRKDEIDYEYKKHFEIEEVEPEKGPFGQLLGLAKQFRGVIGSKFGGITGSALDLLSVADKAGGLNEMMSGAGAEGLGAAAGPLGVALVAKEIGDKINRAVIDGIKGSIGAVGRSANLIASADTDPSVPIRVLGDAASKAGEKIDEYVPVVGKLAIAAGESAKALADFMQEVTRTADRYSEFSPEISMAQAQAEIRQTLGDLRRSREAGPELARFVQAQADLQQRFEDIKIRLLTRILDVVNPILEGMDRIMAGGETLADGVVVIGQHLSLVAQAASLIASLQQRANEPEVLDPTEILLNKHGNTPGGQLTPINELPG